MITCGGLVGQHARIGSMLALPLLSLLLLPFSRPAADGVANVTRTMQIDLLS